MTKDEALKLALEALEANLGNWGAKTKAIPVIRKALAQPEQKQCPSCGGFCKKSGCERADYVPPEQIVPSVYPNTHQLEQKPMGWITYESTRRLLRGGNIKGAVPIHAKKSATAKIPVYITPPQQERNFCPRCGKRLGINDWDVHTCTPPLGKEKNT